MITENVDYLSKVKMELIEWCKQSTSHLMPKIFQKNYLIVKIMWFLFSSISLIFCIYTIIRSIGEYQKYQSYVKIIDLQNTQTLFPTISFCNLNPFNYRIKEYLKKNNMNCSGFFLSSRTFEMKDCGYVLENSYFNTFYITNFFNIIQSDSNFDYDYYSFPLNNILIKCLYNGVDCGDTIFLSYWDDLNLKGLCQAFNHGEWGTTIHRAFSIGANGGLLLELIAGK